MKINKLVKTGNEKEIFNSQIKNNNKTIEFQQVLNKENYEKSLNNLNNILSKIEEQGKRLEQSLNINDLRYYKKMLSEFISEAIYVAYEYEKESFSDRMGRFRKYAIVKKINHIADNLLKEIIKEESSHIEVLKMISDIRGLLLDLIM